MDTSKRSGFALPIVDAPAAAGAEGSLLAPNEHVLSTLDSDGSRRWIHPKLAKGYWWQRRRFVAYILMVVFVAVPHLRFGTPLKPLIRLDIAAREFTILTHTFLPTDTLLLALTMLAAFISIVFITAVTGRAGCGWACPQTVYIEFLFRPIDRLFEGTVGKGGKPKSKMSAARQIGRFAVYVVLNMFLAHTFLSYFVGTDKLAMWIRSSPFEHPSAFLVMAATTGLLTYDFYFFREQTCVIACPYGRFQSVMLDRQSMIVAYDSNRGEPRKKGKHLPTDNAGSCVDCNQCVVVCPTGIDIRDGLQMECINCTQCIDACDDVMEKVGSPTGLIRYSSQAALAGKPKSFVRPRTLIYPAILLIVVSGLAYAFTTKYGFDARIVRGKGNPFTSVAPGLVSNSFSLRLVNRSSLAQQYEILVKTPALTVVDVLEPDTLSLEPDGTNMVPLQIRFPSSLTTGDGSVPITLVVRDTSGNQHTVEFFLLGPRE